MFISFAKITGMGEGCLLSWGEALLGISAGYDQNKKFKVSLQEVVGNMKILATKMFMFLMIWRQPWAFLMTLFPASDEVLNVCVIECILCRYVLYMIWLVLSRAHVTRSPGANKTFALLVFQADSYHWNEITWRQGGLCEITGGPSSSCEMITLQNKSHGEIMGEASPMYVVNLEMDNSLKQVLFITASG